MPINPLDYTNLPTTAPAAGATTISGSVGNQTGTQNTAQQSANQGQARAYFSPEQQAAQQQSLSGLQGYLSGSQQIPAYMTAPPQVFEAYNNAFDKYAKPGIYAQYGAGSPQAMAQQSFGNQQLAANLYQSGVGNWLQGQGMLGNFAFNPQGQNTTAAGQNVGQNQFSQNNTNVGASQTTYGQTLLGMLLSKLGMT